MAFNDFMNTMILTVQRHCEGGSPKQSSIARHCGLDPQSPCMKGIPHQVRNDEWAASGLLRSVCNNVHKTKN